MTRRSAVRFVVNFYLQNAGFAAVAAVGSCTRARVEAAIELAGQLTGDAGCPRRSFD